MTGGATAVLPALAAVVVIGLAGPHRPRARRPLPRATVAGGREGAPTATGWATGIARVAGVEPGPDVGRVGAAAVALAVVALFVAPGFAPVPIVGALGALRWRARARRRVEAEAWRDALPDAVDLFAVALGGGLTVAGALPVVAARAPPPLGPALVEAHRRAHHGEAIDEALARLADAAPPTRPLVAVLVAAHHDGGPVVEAMARLAADERAARRRAVEARARKVPVRMLFPLVLCTLPAFVLVTVVPPVLAAFADLRP